MSKAVMHAYLQCTRLNLILVAVPVDFLLLRQTLEELTGDDVLQPNQARIRLVRVIDHALTHVFIGAGTEMMSLHLQSPPCSAAYA